VVEVLAKLAASQERSIAIVSAIAMVDASPISESGLQNVRASGQRSLRAVFRSWSARQNPLSHYAWGSG